MSITSQISRLCHVSLVEFYLIDYDDIPIDGSAAILGANRTGKSCLLDAIQTGVTGANTDYLYYNASAVRTGKSSSRTFREYCLGVVQHDENDVAKVKRSNACTWIALGFKKADGSEITALVNGVARENREKVGVQWMIVKGRIVTTEDLLVTNQDGERLSANFAVVHERMKQLEGEGVQVQSYDGAYEYAQMLLVTLSHGGWQPDADKYLRSMRRALRFEPVADVTAFMRDYILETEHIDIERMRERLAFYRDLKGAVQDIEAQVISLSGMCEVYNEAWTADADGRGIRSAAAIALVQHYTEELATSRARHEDLKGRNEDAKRTLEKCTEEHQAAVEAKVTAEATRQNDPLERQIREQKAGLEKAGNERLALARHLRSVANLGAPITAGLALFDELEVRPHSFDRDLLDLLRVDLAEFDKVVTQGDLSRLAGRAGIVASRMQDDGARIERQALRVKTHLHSLLNENNLSIERNRKTIEAAKLGRAKLGDSTEQLLLALDEARIDASPLCDLLEIKPEFDEWRMAAEAVLGFDREILIVAAADHARALDVQKGIFQGSSARIVRPDVAIEYAERENVDSLAAIFDCDNRIVRGFINYSLGNILRVNTLGELRASKHAVMTDLMRATPMWTQKLQQPRDFLIGREGRRIASARAEEGLRKAAERTEHLEYLTGRADGLSSAIEQLKADGPGLPAKASELLLAEASCAELTDRLRQLEAGRPTEWAEEHRKLVERVAIALQKMEGARASQESLGKEVGRTEQKIEENARLFNDALVERQKNELNDDDSIAVSQRERQLSMLNAKSRPADWLHDILQLRARADSCFDARDEALRDAEDRWGRHFRDFNSAEMPEMPAQPQWQHRRKAAVELHLRLKDHVLVGKQKEVEEAEKRLAEVFRHEFVGRLVEAFGRIDRAFTDLNDEVRDHDFYGELYVFTKQPVEAFKDIIELVDKAKDETWQMPLWSHADQDSAEHRALATITKFIENSDDEHLRGLANPKAYWSFNTKIISSTTGETVSTLGRRMMAGSGGEGQVPQYIAVVSAVISRAVSPKRDRGALPMVLLDEAFSQLDVQHTRKVLSFIRDLNLQVIIAAPDAKTAYVLHGVDTIINVHRDGNEVGIVPETVTDTLREELSLEDPRYDGFQGFKARRKLEEVDA